MQSSYTDYDPFCKSNHNDCINLECMKLISAIEMQISEGILLEKISKNCTGRIVIRQYFKSEETNLCSKKNMKKLLPPSLITFSVCLGHVCQHTLFIVYIFNFILVLNKKTLLY